MIVVDDYSARTSSPGHITHLHVEQTVMGEQTRSLRRAREVGTKFEMKLIAFAETSRTVSDQIAKTPPSHVPVHPPLKDIIYSCRLCRLGVVQIHLD